MVEKGGAALINRDEVEAMIKAEIAPLQKQVERRRIERIVDRRTAPLAARVSQVEKDVALALTGFELTQRLFEESFARLEIKLDRQQQEIITRLDKAEGWIGQRRRWEKTAVRVSQVAVVGVLRRWLPFVGLFGVMIGLWMLIVNMMGVL